MLPHVVTSHGILILLFLEHIHIQNNFKNHEKLQIQ